MTEREIVRMANRQIQRLRRTGEIGPQGILDFRCEECGGRFRPERRYSFTDASGERQRRRFCSRDCADDNRRAA